MSNNVKKIYWAGDLWNIKDLIGNELLAAEFNKAADNRYQAVLPQYAEANNDKNKSLRDTDFELLFSCDGIVANFDGHDLDSGTVAEFCFAKFLDIPAVLFRSDFRNNNDVNTCPDPWNLMLSNYPRTKTLLLPSMPTLPQIGYQQFLLYAGKEIVESLDEVFAMEKLHKTKEEYFTIYKVALKSAGPTLEKLFSEERIAEIVSRKFK